jgi:hypothetical protein
MNFMYDVLAKAQAEVNEPPVDLEKIDHYNTGINTAVLKLDKYFKLLGCSPLYTAAIILHPARRFEYFEDKWADHSNWIKNARKAFKVLFQKYADKLSPVDSRNESYNLQGESSEGSLLTLHTTRLSIAQKSKAEAKRYGEPGARNLFKVLRPPTCRNKGPACVVEGARKGISNSLSHGIRRLLNISDE